MRHTRTVFATLVMLYATATHATDHNEPELLSSFYSNIDGSGADIYGLFGYPTPDGENLNVILTLAPIPETGRFDSKTIHRIYFSPSRVLEVDFSTYLNGMTPPTSNSNLFSGLSLINPFDILKLNLNQASSFEKNVVRPIAENASELFNIGELGNNMPFDQKTFPEILMTYNNAGTWAKIEFKNFLFNSSVPSSGVTYAKSNGIEADTSKLKTYKYQGIDIFVGGRDDPFYSDIGGFFRSINFAAALKDNDDFTWKSKISSHASFADKEESPRKKTLINRQTHEGVYNGNDWRAGNNINALIFRIPVAYLTARRTEQRVVRMWAEGFVTNDEYNRITKK